jgi:hypothetical protein
MEPVTHAKVHPFRLAVGAKRELELHLLEMEFFEAIQRAYFKKICVALNAEALAIEGLLR